MPRGAVAEPEIGPDTARVPEPPRSAKGLLAVLVGAGLAFAMLAVAAHRVPYFAVDLAITRAIQSVSLQWLDVPLWTLNAMGFPPVVGIVYGLLIASIFVAGARWEALSSGFAVLGGVALNHASKLLVARPRPSIELIAVEHQHIANSSFPAGHVLNFTALAGFLCCLVALRMAQSWQRTTLVSSLIALIVLMGVARIDSGENAPRPRPVPAPARFLSRSIRRSIPAIAFRCSRDRARSALIPRSALRRDRRVFLTALAA